MHQGAIYEQRAEVELHGLGYGVLVLVIDVAAIGVGFANATGKVGAYVDDDRITLRGARSRPVVFVRGVAG